jgi:DnaA-homolog protein
VTWHRIISLVKQLVLSLIPTPTPTFDNFVAGRNQEVLATLKQLILPNPSNGGHLQANSPKVVYLWGVSGSGKSHLLLSTAASLGIFIGVTAAETNPIVILDNVERLDDASQIQLFNAINERALLPYGGVVVAGNVAPRDLPLRPELTSRLGSHLVYQLHPLTDADKAAALNAHAKARGFMLRDDVANYLLRHSRRDMASLMAMLDALDQYSLETGREITLPLLKQMSQPSLV